MYTAIKIKDNEEVRYMSFVMTYLAVAKEVNDKIGIARDLPSYFLGTISPDCVHVRSDYNSDMKKYSHFYLGHQQWGSITNNEEWRNHILKHIKSYKAQQDKEFYMGYFIHILTDISNNEKIWIPFKKNCGNENIPIQNSWRLFYVDNKQIDIMLFNQSQWKNEIWQLLSKASGKTICDKIQAYESEKYRDIVLDDFRTRSESILNNHHAYITIEDNREFTKTTVDEITNLLGNHS